MIYSGGGAPLPLLGLLLLFLSAAPRGSDAGVAPFFDLSAYQDLPEFEAFLHETVRLNPHIAQLRTIGHSHEGRPLLGVKLAARRRLNASDVAARPAAWLDGGNHAREWPAFHVAVYFIQKLVEGYGQVPKITKWLDEMDIYVFPVLNPDGFVFSRTSKVSMIRQWRKNRASENCTGWNGPHKGKCCKGVDLNRNYDFAFKQTNYPFNNPCSDEFQGPYPFSEPESQALRNMVMSKELHGRLHAMLSMHTHGQLFILPYNHRKNVYPEDIADLRRLAERSVRAIHSYRETEYKIGTAADMLGAATGGATDWVKKHAKVKYVYVVELPPDMSTWFAFQMRPHWLIHVAKEMWLGLGVILDQVYAEFGPDLLKLSKSV